MSSYVRFDDAIPAFVDVLIQHCGEYFVQKKGVFLRDALGYLRFIVLSQEDMPVDRERISQILKEKLGGYVKSQDLVLTTPDEMFDESLKDSSNYLLFFIKTENFNGRVQLIDRVVIGKDWFQKPAKESSNQTPILVCSLVKEGEYVESAMLFQMAINNVAQEKNKRFLVIDLDFNFYHYLSFDFKLDNMFLRSMDFYPDFGVLDFLIESHMNPIDEEFYSNLFAKAPYSNNVDVIPAFGKKSQVNHRNILSKLARAYLDTPDENQKYKSITERLKILLKYFDSKKYDAIIINTRIGFDEINGAVFLGLSAEILLIGINQEELYKNYFLLTCITGCMEKINTIKLDRYEEFLKKIESILKF